MDSDIPPERALDTALATRRAASAHRVPTKFVAATAVLSPAGFILLGASDLVGDGNARVVLGGCGVASLALQIALFVALAVSWQRNGVVPDPAEGATSRQRWNRLWLTLVGVAGYATVWVVTGRTGWALIYAGVALAATAGGDRLTRRRRLRQAR